jgi:hypothetical protein
MDGDLGRVLGYLEAWCMRVSLKQKGKSLRLVINPDAYCIVRVVCGALISWVTDRTKESGVVVILEV